MNHQPPKDTQPKLAEAMKKVGERFAEAQRQQNEANQKEDLNILPMPLSQTIKKNKYGEWLEWVWEPVGLGIKIIGILYTQDSQWPDDEAEPKPQGHYEVQLSMPYKELSSCHTLDPIIAKGVGQALISAWNWKDIWKQHAGDFLEKELFGYGTE